MKPNKNYQYCTVIILETDDFADIIDCGAIVSEFAQDRDCACSISGYPPDANPNTKTKIMSDEKIV